MTNGSADEPAATGLTAVVAPVRRARRTAKPGRDVAPPVLVQVLRGPTVESRHRGHVVQVDADGRVVRAAGSPDIPVTLRSTVKPFAALTLITSGAADAFGLSQDELAIMCASHTGEDRHVRTLQAIFRRASISQSLLRCGSPVAPADALTAARLIRDGEAPGPLRHNCSGFHAASLLLSSHAGWPLDEYAEPAHPSQVAVREVVARVFGVRPTALRTSPDNCGLQTYEFPLQDVARAYLLLADPDGRTGADGRLADLVAPLRRIRDAMMGSPEMVGGMYEDLDTQLMRRLPGRLVSKAGADGLRAVGLVPGQGEPAASSGAMAIKIEDGDLSRRAITAASVEALAQVGVLDERDLRQLVPFHHPTVLTPDRREAATALPRFELAPLAELA
jgi:L-asparaginase II